jgi:hypothetical protein
VVLLVVELRALTSALSFRADAFTAAGKRTKQFWCLLTGASVALGVLSVLTSLSGRSSLFFMLIGIVMAGVFLADVRPALRQVMGRAQGTTW